MKVYIETYGCSANFADSEIMAGLLKKADHEITDNFKKADLILINSCYVKDQTETKIKKRLEFFKKINKKLVVAGCFPEANKREVEKIVPSASLIGPRKIEKIVEVVEKTFSGKKVVVLGKGEKSKPLLPKIKFNPIIDIVEINEGCLGNCTFCVTKFARGELYSYPIGTITREIENALKEGCREVWITSQDTGAYGFDSGRDLAELLKKVAVINGRFFVRVGMMNPSNAIRILDQLIDAYKNEKIFKFLHLPAQSGSDKILRLMKRGNNTEQFKEIVHKFREEFPELTLSTDIIVGFPGETKEDFEKTISLINEIKPDIVNISRYGARPGTEAAKMKQIVDRVKKDRSRELTKLVKKIGLEKNKKLIGWSGEILIDEKGKQESWIGRNFAYKPIVVKTNKNLLGKIIKVKIVDAKPTYLIGEVYH